MPDYKIGYHVLVKLSGGRLVEAEVKAVRETTEGVRLQVSFGNDTALIYLCRLLRERDQRMRSAYFTIAVLLEIEDDTFFAPIHIAKEDGAVPVQRPDRSSVVAAGRFHLDHLGAMIGHCQSQIWPGQKRRKIDDANTLQLHAALPVDCSIFPCRNESLVVGAERGANRRIRPYPIDLERT